MTTAIDSNVLAALWNSDDSLNLSAQKALLVARSGGQLVISAPVFAELVASPSRNEAFIDSFCSETGIAIEWDLDESIWRAAGRAFQHYVKRRKTQSDSRPRRILADFVIGAHALRRGYRLLTLDEGLYHSAFPRLAIGRF
ncbi:MAG: PIN domain-containing protein [Candidatus Acidiferrales bacterium]